jgi:hypothetical protein
MAGIKVSRSIVKPILEAAFPEYTGRKISVEFTETVHIHNTNWSGGSRNEYVAVNMESSEVSELPEYAPWSNPVEGATVTLPTGAIIACHMMFCGHDLGIRIYANPSLAPKLLPEAK